MLFRLLNIRFFVAFFMVCAFFGIYIFFKDLVSFDYLDKNREALLFWVEKRIFFASAIYCIIYITFVAFSVPFATVLTVSGGFLFGGILGSVLSGVSATCGASLLFLIVKSGFGHYLDVKAIDNKILADMRAGIKKNIWTYLFLIRLIPVIPFWLANIVPALLSVKLTVYVITTFCGIMPATFLYSYIGSSIDSSFNGEAPELSMISHPEFFIPVFILIILFLLPLIKNRK